MPICKTCKKFSNVDTDECLNCAGSDPSLWHGSSDRRRLRVWVVSGVGFAITIPILWAVFT